MNESGLFILLLVAVILALAAFLYVYGLAHDWRERFFELQDELFERGKERQILIALVKRAGEPITISDEFMMKIQRGSAVKIDRDERMRCTTYSFVADINLYKQEGQE